MSTTTAPVASTAKGTNMLTGLARGTRAELLRLRKWPAVWVTLGAWLALSIMFGYLFNYLSYTSGDESFSNEGSTKETLLAEMMPTNVPDVLVQGLPMFGGALMMVLGAIVAGNGYGWGTWKTAFALGARRGATVIGSLTALTMIVIGTLAASLAVDLGISSLIAVTESQDIVMPSTGSVIEASAVGFAVLEMWAVIGFLLGTVARGPALSVGLGLVWSLVVENLLRGVGALLSWVETLTEFLPGTAAGSLVGSIVDTSEGGDGTPGVLDTVPGDQAAITVAVYIAVAAVAAVLLVRRRDVA